MKTAPDLSEVSVNDTIRIWPATVDVFNAFGIDACCGGSSGIVEAAERDGADAVAMLEALRRVIEGAE